MIKTWQLGLFESMASTPVKVERIDCFVCVSKNVTTFKLRGRKLKGENFYCKLKQVVGDDIIGDLYENDVDPGLCRNCYSKTLQFCEFSDQAKTSALSFLLSGAVSTKRGMLSPLTPKSVHNPGIDTVRGSSRKQLKLLPETASTPPTSEERLSAIRSTPLINKSCRGDISKMTINIDHSYNAHTTKDSTSEIKATEEETLSTLKQMFYINNENRDLPQNVMLQTLRSQSFSLTSKTAPFTPVLCYKGPDQIIESDRIIHDIICEMEKR